MCGTGINCLGLAPDGREVRFLSLGPEISGDWGGGRDVGLARWPPPRAAPTDAGRARCSSTPCRRISGSPTRSTWRAHSTLREIPAIRLGELAPVVLALCDEDAVAAEIVRRLADEVVAFACAALRRLELTADDPDVVLGGRLLRAVSPRSGRDGSLRQFTEVAPHARVVVSPSEPIVGAALLGLDALGADAVARARARTELDAAAALRSVVVVDRLG